MQAIDGFSDMQKVLQFGNQLRELEAERKILVMIYQKEGVNSILPRSTLRRISYWKAWLQRQA